MYESDESGMAIPMFLPFFLCVYLTICFACTTLQYKHNRNTLSADIKKIVQAIETERNLSLLLSFSFPIQVNTNKMYISWQYIYSVFILQCHAFTTNCKIYTQIGKSWISYSMSTVWSLFHQCLSCSALHKSEVTRRLYI
jgi:hypothetical protein